MIRHIACAAVFLAAACSSSSSSGPSCRIEGSYSATAALSPGSTCPTSGPGTPVAVTDTITARPPGATGPDFALEITGVQGGCNLNYVAGESCKVQGKCDVQITDALDPNNATGTTQYSWTFTENGFTGTSTVVIPPAKSLPKGCSEQAQVTGTRQ